MEYLEYGTITDEIPHIPLFLKESGRLEFLKVLEFEFYGKYKMLTKWKHLNKSKFTKKTMPKNKIYKDERAVISIRSTTKDNLMVLFPEEPTPDRKIKKLIENETRQV